MLNTPNIVIIPFLDLPVFKLRYSLAHRIVLRLSPFIFNFLGAFTNKVSNFLAVIASAFILINGSTSHPMASHIWTVIKPAAATKSTIWSKVSVLVHAISFIAPIGKVLAPRSKCPIILVSLVVSYIFCAPWPQFPNDLPPWKLLPLLGGVITGLNFCTLALESELAVCILNFSSPIQLTYFT